MPKPSNVWAEAWAKCLQGKGYSVNADQWPGVVAAGQQFRVVVPRDAKGYRLQRRTNQRDKWSPVHGRLCDWADVADRLRALDPVLAAQVEALPVDPIAAVAPLVAALGGSVRARKRRTEWAAPDYRGVLRQDANMRAVRDLSGTVYGVQWVSIGKTRAGKVPRWITQASGPAWPLLVERLAAKTYEPASRSKDGIRDRMAALFQGCPEVAADGPWPVVKVRPGPSSRPVTKK